MTATDRNDPPPLQQGGKGGRVRPQTAGGAGTDPHLPGTVRGRVLIQLAAGRSIKQTAKSLEVHPSTVQEHRDRLLLEGGLQRTADHPPCFYSRGPAYTALLAAEGGAGPDRGVRSRPRGARSQPAPRLGFSKVTRGQRGIVVLSAPADPTQLPGFIETRLCGKGAPERRTPHHFYEWAYAGRLWPIRYMAGRTRQSVQLSAPKDRMARGEVPGRGNLQDKWSDLVSKVAHAWAALGGLELGRNRQAVAQVSDVELEIADLPGRESARSAGGLVDINTTPKKGTVETTSQEIADHVEALPLTQPAQDRAIAANAAVLAALQRNFAKVQAVVEGQAETLQASLAVHVAQAQFNNGVLLTQASVGARPVAVAEYSPPQPAVPGVEYA